MTDVDILGPFRALPLYRDENLALDSVGSSIPLTTLGSTLLLDFDVRPQRTVLTDPAIRKRLAQLVSVDWDEIIQRSIVSIAKTLGLDRESLDCGVEGECDGGAVVCWVQLVNCRTRPQLRTIRKSLGDRVRKQRWPQGHPDRVTLGSSVLPVPGQDRVCINLLEPNTRTMRIPMLAENFQLVNQVAGHIACYPFLS